MYRKHSRANALRGAVANARFASAIVLVGAALGSLGCASVDEDASATATAEQSCRREVEPTPYSCGFKMDTDYRARWRNQGYSAEIELLNVAGEKATAYEVFADLGGAAIRHCRASECTPVEGGYLFTAPRDVERHGIRRGQTEEIRFESHDAYAGLQAYVISVNGVLCDAIAPTVSLESSGNFYTAGGALTLTATAADNVAVKKVVFLRDGEVIGTDSVAPYALEVPITSSLNGRDRYTVVAYDVSGNSTTSNAKSVLTAIGNKFFGTAVDGAGDYGNLLTYFNQITPGNSGKWGTVEAVRDQMNWTDLDTAYAYAQANQLPFKLHTLIWGSQQPSWLNGLTAEEQLAEIEQWMTAAAARYPNVAMVDVVNEPLHSVPAYSAALGGPGATGYDWVIKAFEMARQHFPNAELLVNDYNVEALDSWASDYLTVINLLNARGLVDGIGLQAHFLERAEMSVVAANLNRFAATGLPIYVSELDVNFANDARQAQRMRDLFTLFWNHPQVLGITHWGYRQGAMWRPDSYLLRTDATMRPALDWIQCFRAGGSNCTVPDYVPTPRIGDAASITLEAEDYDNAQGLLAAGNVVAYVDNGDWVSFDRVVFDSNWDSLAVTYAKGNQEAANITVHLGSLDSPPVATVQLPSTGSWGTSSTVKIPWAPISGERNVFVRFNGGYGVANLDSLKFAAPTGLGANVVSDSDFEAGNGGWWSWGGGTIATTTAFAVSGTQSLGMTARNGNSPLVKSLTSNLVPGKTYKVSLWATIDGAASAAAHVTKKIQCAGQSASYSWLGGEVNITSGNWVEFTGDLVIPDCALGDVTIYLEGPGAGVNLYVDHVSARPVAAANLVPNGTFESGSNGWFTWNGGTITATTARARTGSKSLVVTGRTSNAPAATDLSSVVKAGGSYPVSAWVSIDSPDGVSKKVNLTRKIGCAGKSDSYSWVGNQVTVADDGTWVQILGTLSIPADCSSPQVQLFAEGETGADLYVDDVSVTDPSLSNVLPDGTFESGIGSWFTWNGSLATTSTISHSGAQAAVLTNRTGNGPIARSLMGIVTAGKNYQVTFWTTIGGAATANVNLTRKIGCSGTDSYAWLVNPVTVTSGVWTKLTGTLAVTDCTLSDVMVYAEGPGAGIDLYIDDVSVSLIP